MVVLGIETSSAVCSVGILDSEGKTFERRVVESHIHSEKILTIVDEVLTQARTTLAACSAVAVSIGPGSFTGLRIGVSSAKGLCSAMNVPVVAVPTFGAIAAGASNSKLIDSELLEVWIDAKQGDWYVERFVRNGRQFVSSRPVSISKREFLHSQDNASTTLLTDHPERFLNTTLANIMHVESFLSGAAVARFGQEMLLRFQTSNLANLEPLYLKDFIVRDVAKSPSP